MPDVRIKGAPVRKPGIQYPASAELRSAPALWHKENFVGVRILYLGAGRESCHIDIFSR